MLSSISHSLHKCELQLHPPNRLLAELQRNRMCKQSYVHMLVTTPSQHGSWPTLSPWLGELWIKRVISPNSLCYLAVRCRGQSFWCSISFKYIYFKQLAPWRTKKLKAESKFGLQNLFPSIDFEWKQFWLDLGIINIPQESFGSWPPVCKFRSGFNLGGC